MRPPRSAAILLLLLVACGGKSPDEKLLDDLQPAASWTASLQMLSAKWLHNNVPTKFALNTVDAAEKEFEKSKKSVEKSDASPDLRRDASRILDEADGLASELSAAIEGNDRNAALSIARRFSGLSSELEALKKKEGGSS